MTAATGGASASRGWRAAYGRVLEWLVIALMVGLAAEVTLGVVFRSIGHSLIWYDEVAPDHQRNVTVFADGEVDRSPCGSGTSARLSRRSAKNGRGSASSGSNRLRHRSPQR